MCGIAGLLYSDPSMVASPAHVRAMLHALRHRGPDSEGVWTSGPIGLGSRRLAVIDLSRRADQPVANEDGRVRVVFNGEIYNFETLRQDSTRRGHVFQTLGDTEALVHLYEDAGVDGLQRLSGMFAFALWDAGRRVLLLARDRLGKKPLYYYRDADVFLFASEPKAILQHPAAHTEVDTRALHHYMTYGYVPAPWSAFRGIHKLPPAHYLLLEDSGVTVAPYWSLRYTPKRTEPEPVLAEELLALLEQAVKQRLVSDVPLGALLSGGVDSSTVVALMRRFLTTRLRTFSIGFESGEYDELAYARLVARHFDTDHHELVVKPDAAAGLARLVWHYDQPFADSSALPTMALCEMARGCVTVALAGDGGDEIFAGYDRYRAVKLAVWPDGLPAVVRRSLAAAASRLPPGPPKSPRERVRRFAGALALAGPRRYARWTTLFDEEERRRLYSDDFAEQVAHIDPLGLLDAAFDRSDASSVVERAMHADVQLYLPDDLLVKIDIASMAYSLEVRSPLLDHHVVEFAATLPTSLKLRGFVQKYLLKRVMKGILPDTVLRRRKMGFAVPVDHWFRGELREMAYDVLLGDRARARGYFRPGVVRRYLDEHSAGTAHHHARLWALLVLELWHRMFVDQPAPAEMPA